MIMAVNIGIDHSHHTSTYNLFIRCMKLIKCSGKADSSLLSKSFLERSSKNKKVFSGIMAAKI